MNGGASWSFESLHKFDVYPETMVYKFNTEEYYVSSSAFVTIFSPWYAIDDIGQFRFRNFENAWDEYLRTFSTTV